jgi:hypothetical protein
VVLTAFAKKNILDHPAIEDVSFLGSSEKIAWKYEEEKGLLLTAPPQATDTMATVIKISVSQ